MAEFGTTGNITDNSAPRVLPTNFPQLKYTETKLPPFLSASTKCFLRVYDFSIQFTWLKISALLAKSNWYLF